MGKHVLTTGQLGPRTARGTALASLENAAVAAGIVQSYPVGRVREGGHRQGGSVLRWVGLGRPRQPARRAAS